MRHRPWSKKLVFILAFLLVVAVTVNGRSARIALQATVATVRNEPSALVVDRDRHDFGVVKRGSTPEARLRLANAGGRRLILRREDGGCPCLSSDRELLLQPGASHELALTLDTREFDGPTQTSIRYRTNDPRRPVLEIVLIADVEPRMKHGSNTHQQE